MDIREQYQFPRFAPRNPLLVLMVEDDSLAGRQRNFGRYIQHVTELRTGAQQEDILGPSRHIFKPGV